MQSKRFFVSQITAMTRLALFVVSVAALAATARAEVYVTYLNFGSVGKYNNDGTLVSNSFITGLTRPYGITVAGSYIYVADQDLSGNISKYNLDGSVVCTTFISGLYNPSYALVNGAYIYVSNTADGEQGHGYIGKYNLDGTVVDDHFITNLDAPRGMAIVGANLFIANQGNATITGYVGLYDSVTGTVGNATLIQGLHNADTVVSYSGNLLVSYDNFPLAGGSVGIFGYDGSVVNNLFITDTTYQLVNIALLGTDAFITLPGANSYGKYDLTTGFASQYVTLAHGSYGIAVTPQTPVPEPSTWALLAGGAAMAVVVALRRRKAAQPAK